jgi:hypothetical protein
VIVAPGFSLDALRATHTTFAVRVKCELLMHAAPDCADSLKHFDLESFARFGLHPGIGRRRQFSPRHPARNQQPDGNHDHPSEKPVRIAHLQSPADDALSSWLPSERDRFKYGQMARSTLMRNAVDFSLDGNPCCAWK